MLNISNLVLSVAGSGVRLQLGTSQQQHPPTQQDQLQWHACQLYVMVTPQAALLL
jgi:hypothetical protein